MAKNLSNLQNAAAVDLNQRGGPFGDFIKTFGPNGGVTVEVIRDTGLALNPYDAHSEFTITGADGKSVTGQASSEVFPNTANASLSVSGENFRLQADGSADKSTMTAEGTLALTVRGHTYVVEATAGIADDVVTVTLDATPNVAGNDFVLSFDQVSQVMTVSGPHGRSIDAAVQHEGDLVTVTLDPNADIAGDEAVFVFDTAAYTLSVTGPRGHSFDFDLSRASDLIDIVGTQLQELQGL